MYYFQFRIIAVAAFIAALAFNTSTTKLQAHGFEGDRFFPPTIQTDDAFASDELALPTILVFNNPAGSNGTPKTREIDISSQFNKEIFPKFALGVTGTYVNLNPQGHQGPAQDGFSNIQFSAKYQLWEDAPHEWILSLGCLASLGDSGSKALSASGMNPVNSFTTYTPTVYFGKGFGDLPDSLKYFKPLALTGTVGVAIPGQSANTLNGAFNGFNSDALQYGFALEYSLPYLQEHVEDVGMPRPLRNMIPLVEVSMNSPLDRSGQTTTGTINPGVLWETKYAQFGAEAVIPVNAHTGPNVGAVFQVQIFIDDLFPKVFGHPIFFGDNK